MFAALALFTAGWPALTARPRVQQRRSPVPRRGSSVWIVGLLLGLIRVAFSDGGLTECRE
eukprot:12927167-Prorocentrum_lima.AAC.1